MNMGDKQFYMAQELGRAQGRIKLLEASVTHYRELVGQRTKALHGAEREIRRLKKELKAAKATGEPA
jgi:predicted  nucleic acid-binding Zn-ribbon protein